MYYHVQNNGNEIQWSHLVRVFEQTRSQAGLSILPKLRYEHIYLSSFSKMRVDLAVQVISKFNAKPKIILNTCRSWVIQFPRQYTSLEIRLLRKQQICRNVRQIFWCPQCLKLFQWEKKRKPFQSPYRSGSDFRLKVCKLFFFNFFFAYRSL